MSAPTFLEHLQEACDLAEVGFHFEEGGCYGMALAIRDALAEDGIPSRIFLTDRLAHAYVGFEGVFCDYTGIVPDREPSEAEPVDGDADFVALVVAAGARDEDSILSDADLAADVVANARRLAVEIANAPGIRPRAG